MNTLKEETPSVAKQSRTSDVSEMTLKEAISVIAKNEEKLKKAKKKITPEPLNKNDHAGHFLYHYITTSVPLGFLVSSIPFEDANEVGIVLGIAGGFLTGLISWSYDEGKRASFRRKIFSPKRYKANKAEYEIDKEFHALSLENYHKTEKKILKKTVKAIEFANQNLKTKEVVFSDNSFAIQEKKMNPWEKLILEEVEPEETRLEIETVKLNEDKLAIET